MKYFVVIEETGPAWDSSLSMRQQKLWAEHAAFMNKLVDEGFVVLGGPLNNGSRMLIVNTDGERTIETRLAADPWMSSALLQISRIDSWEILLGKIG